MTQLEHEIIAESVRQSVRDIKEFNLNVSDQELGEIVEHIVTNLMFALSEDAEKQGYHFNKVKLMQLAGFI